MPTAVQSDHVPLVEEMRAPITDASPCGGDVTYDETFQQLAGEINKLGTVSGRIDHERLDSGGSAFSVSEIDYERIVRLSRSILRTQSKDLRVASYLVLGMFHTRGIDGLSEGVEALNAVVDTFWDDLYPPSRRARARAGAIELLSGRLTESLLSYKATESDGESLERTVAGLVKLQGSLKEKLDGNEPAMDGLIHALTECRRRVRKTPPSGAASPGSGEHTGAGDGSAGPAAGPAEEGRNAGGDAAARPEAQREMKSVSDAERSIFEASGFLGTRDQASPVPYRLNRSLRWGAQLQEPPHEDGKTQLPAPLKQRRDYLLGLHDMGDFATLIREAEASFQEPPFHFWLDLQRLLATAAEAQGATFRQVRNAVLEETALLVRRLPGLPVLTFTDGTPFADPQTREWIDVRAKATLGSADEGGVPHSEESAHLQELFAEAREHLGEGDLAGALSRMQEGREQDTSQKDRFNRRLYLALLCLRGGQAAIARPVLESLDEEIDRRSIEAWDPALALQVWSNLYTCYETLGRGINNPDKQTVREQAARIFEKICRLDAGYALSFVSKGKR